MHAFDVSPNPDRFSDMKPNVITLCLAIAATATGVSAAGCRQGTELTNGKCCPIGKVYMKSDDGKVGTCCAPNDTFHHGPKGKICCPPDFEYKPASNQCVKTWKVTQEWWKANAGWSFQVDGHWVKVVKGGFEADDGKFYEFHEGGITINGRHVDINDEFVYVHGQRVELKRRTTATNQVTGGQSEDPEDPEDPEEDEEAGEEDEAETPEDDPKVPSKNSPQQKPITGMLSTAKPEICLVY